VSSRLDTALTDAENSARAKKRAEAISRTVRNARALIDKGYPGRASELLEAALGEYPGDPALQAEFDRARRTASKESKAERVESVCRETRVSQARRDFETALKTVEVSLENLAGERRLVELRETVIAARRASKEKTPAAHRPLGATAVTDDMPISSPSRHAELA